MHTARFVVVLTCTAILASACSNGGGGVPDGIDAEVDVATDERACRAAPEQIASRNRCQTDESCPCGTFCDLGRCAAECTSDADCGGDLVCNLAGQCSVLAAADRLRLPAEQTGGHLFFPSLRRNLAGDQPIAVHVNSGAEPVSRARFEAFSGAEVRCPGADVWAAECELTDIAADSQLVVEVRQASGAAQGEANDIAYLEVHTPQGSESMSLFRNDQTVDELSNGATGTSALIQGGYSGSIRLAAVGTDRDLEGLAAPAASITLPISAVIWEDGDGFVIELADTYNTLTSGGSFVGRMTVGEEDTATTLRAGTAEFPVHPFVETVVAGRATALLSRTVAAKVLTRDRPRTLSLELTQSYVGVGAGFSPSARWVVELTRIEGARGLAPEIPADATVTAYDPAARLGAATPWEEAFGQTTGGVVDRAAARSWYDGGIAPLGMCDATTASTHTAEALLGSMLDLDGREIGPIPVDDTPFFPLLKDALEDLGVGPSLSFNASASPTLENGELPCALFNLNLSLDSDFGAWRSGYASAIDFCDELAQRTGCTVETIADRSLTSSVTGTYTDAGGATGVATASYSMWATEVCRLPAAAPNCGESIFCMDPGPEVAGVAYGGSSFDVEPANLELSGDFACTSGTRNATIALDSIASGTSVNQAIRSCLAELDALSQAPPTPTALYGAGFAELYPAAQCVGVGRMLTALAAETQALRGVPTSSVEGQVVAGAAFSHRLLSRWLNLHGFIAAEANQIDGVRGIFLPGSEGEGRLIDAAQAREATLSGWDLILSQHILYALLNAPQPVLEEPDYRLHRTNYVPTQPDEPTRPLAAVILDTLARQAGNLTQAMEQAADMTDEERSTRLRDFNARAVIALAIAADLQARASTGTQSTFVRREVERAAQRVLVRTSAYSEVIMQVEVGDGLIGVSDRNLPLYFQTSTITGAAGRFTAISDFIAGSGPGSSAWAPAMVQMAQASLEGARQAFLDESDRDMTTARYQRDVDVWASEVRADYNTRLWDFCGPIGGSPIDDPDFDASQCAISKSPQCTIDIRTWYTSWTPDDLMARFCVNDAITRGTFDNELGFVQAETRGFAAACVLPNPEADYPVSIQDCANDASLACLRCDADSSVPELELSPVSLAVLAETVGARDDVPSNLWDRQWSTCQTRYAQARRDVPAPSSPFEEPDCVSGSIGEAYLGVVSANLDLQEARAQIAEHLEAYDIAMESCTTLEDGNEDLKGARSKHATNMSGLRIAKGVADSAAAAAAATKDCMATAASSDKSNPISAITSTVGTTGACIAAAAESVATIASISLGAEMERAQLAHDDNVAGIEAGIEVEICFNDAKLELVGSTTASYALERASFDLEIAHATVAGVLASAQAVHADGYGFIQESELFRAPSPAGDPWVNENILRYTRDFALARRATYLAVRAVEYEFQQALALRQQVLEATLPSDLEAVLQELWQESGTRSILGNRPTELNSVVSLRDDIFQLSDRSTWPEGTRSLSPEERFHLLLNSERYAVYDVDGRYEGQRIPFSLAPLGALGVDAGGVSIYSENDCAERLWSVNASIIGDNLYRGSDTSFIRVDVLKRNTFYSQWCGQAPADQPFQLATVNPTRNLFRVPGFGQEVGTEQGVEQSRDRFSRARIQAFFGVGRAALEDTQYANGETSELAARGLYGDYALFIPASLIARDDSDGLVLDHVDDILLRLDYLSVASP